MPIATLKVRIREPMPSQFRSAVPTQAQVTRLPMAAIEKHNHNNCDTGDSRIARHERSGCSGNEHPCFRIGVPKGSALPERKRLQAGRIRVLACRMRVPLRELPRNEKQIRNAGPLDQRCGVWIGKQQSCDASAVGDQHGGKSGWHAQHVWQHSAKIVIRAGHRRDHVVGSGREGTDERQYCQREQLFMRHCEFYSVLQAILEQHLEACRRMQR